MASIHLPIDIRTARRFTRAFRVLGRNLNLPTQAVGRLPFPMISSLPFTGLDLLLDIGIACTQPYALYDPSSLYALLRYGTALVETGRKLALSAAVNELDPHKKMVLSDEFGCGVAFRAARSMFRAGMFLDVSTAIERKWLKPNKGNLRRPDYIGLLPSGDMILFEAKGSQSGPSYCRTRQIPSGCDQLAAVGLGPRFKRKITHRVVVATAIAKEASKWDSLTLIGDPPGRPEIILEPMHSPDELILRSHYTRVASLTADEELLDHLFPNRPRPEWAIDQTRPHAPEIHDIRGVPFRGRELRIESAEGSMRVYVGLLDAVRMILLSPDFGARQIMTFNEQLHSPVSPNVPSRSQRPNALEAFSNDGCVLSVTVDNALAESGRERG